MPAHCPGDAADERPAALFRACIDHPPSVEDYTPHNESTLPAKMRRADPENCIGWGLSVWVNEDELLHARQHVMPWMMRRYIFRSDVNVAEGRLSDRGASGHHTYWAYQQTDVRARAVLFLEPEGN